MTHIRAFLLVLSALLLSGCDLAIIAAGAAKASAENNVITPPGTTALHHAACAQDLKKLKTLIEDGYAVDAKNKNDETPLAYAIRCGSRERSTDVDVVRFFLAAGANPNARVRDDGTVLHVAARRGDASLLRLLLANGANVDLATHPGGPTALYRAVEGQSPDSVQELIGAGANLQKQRYVRKALTTHGVCDKDFDTSVWSLQRVDSNERALPTRIRTLEVLMEAGAEVSDADLIAGDRHCKRPDWDRGENRLVRYVKQNHADKIVSATARGERKTK